MNTQVKQIISCISVVLGIGCLSGAYAESSPSIVMATMHPSDSYEGKLSRMIYQEAFKRLGIELRIEEYPAPRATAMAEHADVAGELTRSYEYQSVVKNLIRVEEPLFEFRIAGFARKPIIQLNGWDSLKGTSLRINYRRGLKDLEQRLPELVNMQLVESLTRPEQGVKKLISDRIDLYIDIADEVMMLLATPEFKTADIQDVGTLKTSTTHGYMHTTYQELVPKLETVLKQMKQKGLIEQYRNTILGQ